MRQSAGLSSIVVAISRRISSIALGVSKRSCRVILEFLTNWLGDALRNAPLTCSIQTHTVRVNGAWRSDVETCGKTCSHPDPKSTGTFRSGAVRAEVEFGSRVSITTISRDNHRKID